MLKKQQQMDFISRLQHLITEYRLFEPKDRLLLAMSGGKDSTCMAHALQQLGYFIGLAHCNFQLRGEESNGDEQFVRELAFNYQVPFFNKQFDTSALAEKRKESIQMLARQLRYTWLEELRHKEGYQYILTAHHQDDSAETVLLNLVRGTGPAGLHGILPKRNKLVRPLVFFPRQQLNAYAEENELPWREDSTNLLDKYHRNFLRLHVLPLLKELNPKVSEAIAATSQNVLAMETYLNSILEEEKGKVSKTMAPYTWVDLTLLKQAPDPTLLLYHILQEYGFSHKMVEEILASEQNGAIFYSPSHRALLDRKNVIVEMKQVTLWQPRQVDENEVLICSGIQNVQMEHLNKWQFKEGEILLDKNKLLFPIIIRKWEKGDKFKPLGMKQQKKISDFLVDEKVHLFDKEKVLVVVSQGQIAGVLGHRPAEEYKVTSHTKVVSSFSLV